MRATSSACSALYDEATTMTSDRIPALGFDASGTVRGKDALRAYWGKALGMLPNLHFSLIDVFVSPDSVVVFYSERGGKTDLRISAGQGGGVDRAGFGETYRCRTNASSVIARSPCDEAIQTAR